MPAKMTNAYRQHERGTLIVGEIHRKGLRDKARAAKLNAAIDNDFLKARLSWVFLPPSNINLLFRYRDTDVVVSVYHELGRALVHRKVGHIIGRDVVPDVVVEDTVDLSEALTAFGLGPNPEPQEPSMITIRLLEDASESLSAGTVINVPASMGQDLIKYEIAVETNEPAAVVVA